MKNGLARGGELTKLAAVYGLKRRWFGLEPDEWLRRRVIKKLIGYVP